MSQQMFAENVLFGTGFGGNISQMTAFLRANDLPVFVQPVHNIFILILVEQGILGFVFFVLFLRNIFLYPPRSKLTLVLLVNLVQVVLISFFDHYFWTIHQTFLLLILTLAFYLSRILGDEKVL
jgi:O-antigen ligase